MPIKGIIDCVILITNTYKNKFCFLFTVSFIILAEILSLNIFEYDKSEFVVMASYPGNKTKAVAAEGCVYGGAVYAGFLWD